MTQLDDYYVKGGLAIKRYLSGDTNFEQLIDQLDPGALAVELRQSELAKLLWHTVYQYQLDIESEDGDYVNSVRYWLNEISKQLINDDESAAIEAIKNYHNDPFSRVREAGNGG